MFKFLVFAAIVAVCAAKPGVVAPLAYSAYPAGVAAYSAYPAGVAAYSAYPSVSAYSALPATYPGVSAYTALPSAYSGIYPGVSAYSQYSSPLIKSPLAYSAGVPLSYTAQYY